VPRTAIKKSKKRESAAVLVLIALFKLVKALALVAIGIGALKYLHKDLAVLHWVNVLRVDPDNRFIHRLLAKAFSVTPKQLKELSVGTFFYASLLGIEGIGLLLRKHWAEYFTIITTGALLPLEVYELVKHVTVVKIIVLVINAAIVWYLVIRVRSRRHQR
jgi:uncharacterized membrane protein (DUF2068 family)